MTCDQGDGRFRSSQRTTDPPATGSSPTHCNGNSIIVAEEFPKSRIDFGDFRGRQILHPIGEPPSLVESTQEIHRKEQGQILQIQILIDPMEFE
jgi:hypothetical protein